MNIELHVEVKPFVLRFYSTDERVIKQTVQAFICANGLHVNIESVELPEEGNSSAEFSVYEDSKEIIAQTVIS